MAASDESVITTIQPLLDALVPRVLLVDDDEIAIERLRYLITSAGYEVATVSNGQAALAALRTEFAPIVIIERPNAWSSVPQRTRSASKSAGVSLRLISNNACSKSMSGVRPCTLPT